MWSSSKGFGMLRFCFKDETLGLLGIYGPMMMIPHVFNTTGDDRMLLYAKA
jgi:hypothetical protein